MRAAAAASAAAACASATWTCSSLDATAAARPARTHASSYIAQSAAASFDPSRTILDQVVEPAVVHGTLPRGEAELKAIALFRELALAGAGDDRPALPAPGLGRPAAAADGGDGADHRPRGRDPRRADHRARRDDAGRGAARLPPRGARAPGDGGVRQPRPGGGGADGRPHPGAARRPHARGRHHRAAARRAAERIHAEPARRGAAGARAAPARRAPAPRCCCA